MRRLPGQLLHRLAALLEGRPAQAESIEPAPAREKPRPRVLIHAAAGGVGTAAVQLGHILGFELFGTASSPEKLAKLTALGLTHGIDYTNDDYEERIRKLTAGEGVDAVFDSLAGEHTFKSLGCCAEFGRVILFGNATGEPAQFNTSAMYAKGLSAHGLWLTSSRPITRSSARPWTR